MSHHTHRIDLLLRRLHHSWDIHLRHICQVRSGLRLHGLRNIVALLCAQIDRHPSVKGNSLKQYCNVQGR